MGDEYEDKLEKIEQTLADFMLRVEPLLGKNRNLKTQPGPATVQNGLTFKDFLDFQSQTQANQAVIINAISESILKAQAQAGEATEKINNLKIELKEEMLDVINNIEFEDEPENLGSYGNGKDKMLADAIGFISVLDQSGILSAFGIKNPMKKIPIPEQNIDKITPEKIAQIEGIAKKPEGENNA